MASLANDKNATGRLNALLREVFNKLDDERREQVFPEDLADEVMEQLDPGGVTQELIGWAARLELRQLARQICAHRLQTMQREAESGQLEFETFKLQERYPAMRAEGRKEPREAYVLRGCLTYWERMINVDRLKKEGTAKLFHADALEEETNTLVREGLLEIGRKPAEPEAAADDDTEE